MNELRLTNPERIQDRAADMCDTFGKYGYVMFPQQRSIYAHLARRCAYRSVLEAGCGDGVGAAQLERRARVNRFIATDKLASNVLFARCLYPWIKFDVWDLAKPWHGDTAENVVCVEAIEHVADPEKALRHLLDAATVEVWISTPNGTVKQEHPPSNEFHVSEYTPAEMLRMLKGNNVTIMGWENLEFLPVDTEVNPLVYRVVK